MKIGILCHSSTGGSSHIAISLSGELARRGHEIHLFTYEPAFKTWRIAPEVAVHSVPLGINGKRQPGSLYMDWPSPTFASMAQEIYRVVKESGLDVVHFHYALPFAFLAAELKGTLGEGSPILVGTLHGSDVSLFGRDPERRPMLCRALSRMDALTTVSSDHARLAATIFDLDKPPRVIPNFVDLNEFRPRSGTEADAKKDTVPHQREAGVAGKKAIVHISNFRPVKDVCRVARIFLEIRKDIAAELWLVGQGEDMGRVCNFLSEKGADGDVRLFGFHQKVAPILAAADLLLMASLEESFCLVALEAMACGVPVLSTRVGGIPEIVAHGKTGYLYRPGDHHAAVEFGLDLLTDPEKRKYMGMEGVKRARDFDINKVVTVYERLYREQVGVSCGPPGYGRIYAAA
ncbi:MAG: N-acetyl-alpha-D-glucosaminyl L-malate synthase BshA [Deltaproteobacteria bacterium]|nr:N-acetyl-alpha-D-glucosaminyl L-malate synthase BshA [Deltaproteobacteria bacterium]